MNNQNNQPAAIEEVENQSTEENEKEEIEKTRLEKIIVKLKKVTGDEKKAKLIVGLFRVMVNTIVSPASTKESGL